MADTKNEEPHSAPSQGETSRPVQAHQSSIIRWREFVDEQVAHQRQLHHQPVIIQDRNTAGNHHPAQSSSRLFRVAVIILICAMAVILVVTVATLLALYVASSTKPY